MAKRGNKILCDNSYCRKVIPENSFDDGKHDAPQELQPFVEANRLLTARRERGEKVAGELWTPQSAHEMVREGKSPVLPQEGNGGS